ncbi:conserved hypothetical protein [Ricinus communis]|uniref:Uncharacterized protein n=1 Tax=Ricinus communis TaxID=3988 RepID=B9RP28_RICCO|nr:conserved hypothetical protein [Ricinus communis]
MQSHHNWRRFPHHQHTVAVSLSCNLSISMVGATACVRSRFIHLIKTLNIPILCKRHHTTTLTRRKLLNLKTEWQNTTGYRYKEN